MGMTVKIGIAIGMNEYEINWVFEYEINWGFEYEINCV